MNWLDNIIGFFSPSWAYKRQAYRTGLEKVRSGYYDSSDSSRLNKNWVANNAPAVMTDSLSRDNIRARARDLERNSDIMNAILSAYNRNVVGEGFTLQARTDNEELNNKIEELWRVWSKKKNCDISKNQNLIQMLRMIERRKRVDGGILIQKCYTDDGVLPLKLSCLEVDEIDKTVISPHYEGNKVVDGVEVNEYGAAVGYHIRRYSRDGYLLEEPHFVKAEDMIFVFSKTRPSQVREMSDLNPTLLRVRDITEFMTAVSVKQRIEACMSVFIKKGAADELGRGIVKSNNQAGYDGKLLSPGMIKVLNPGESIDVVNPNGQAADATSYIKLQNQLLGAGQGLSYEATTRDMSQTNYSSARQGLIEDNLTYAEDRGLLGDLVDEIYEAFITCAVLSKKLDIPDFVENKEKYFKHEWIQAGRRWIDPLKEASAMRLGMASGQKTFKQIAAENGKDWREQIEDIAEVIAYGNDLGIDLGHILYGINSGRENG